MPPAPPSAIGFLRHRFDYTTHKLDEVKRFYTELLGAIPDIHFDLQHIVIGPQGVCEEAKVTGTQQGKWLSRAATGAQVEFRVVIFFPWDQGRKKFRGERVFVQV